MQLLVINVARIPEDHTFDGWAIYPENGEFDGLAEFFVTQKKTEEGDFIEIYERHSQNLLVSGLRGDFEFDGVISMLKESPYQIELSSDELNALYVIFEMQDDADYFDGSANWIQSIGEEGELNDSSPEKMRGGLIISCLPYYKVSESTDIEEFVEKENCHEEHRFCGVRLKTS